MLFVIVILLGFVAYRVSSRNSFQLPEKPIESVPELEAVYLDKDMASKLKELLSDPAMTAQKWKEWLLIFEAADQSVKGRHNVTLSENVDYIRDMISDEDLAGL